MESIDLRDYIRPLQRWWWLLLASTLVATAASLFVTLQAANAILISRATLMVGASIHDPNPNPDEIYLAQQLVNTYVDLSQRSSVRGPAMAALGLNCAPPYAPHDRCPTRSSWISTYLTPIQSAPRQSARR